MATKHPHGSKLGAFLHDARAKAGMSQKEVGDLFGYKSAQVISDWERGLRAPPSTVLKRLASLYQIPMETFFELILEERKAILEAKLRKSLGVKAKASR